jgi:UDP-2-acetamido-3-amino-2,3-dideoxy-glucuronate N-acetyltransferase
VIEAGVAIGAGTTVWDHVHVRKNARIGSHCIIGEKTYIAYDVKIGNGVKINAFVYLCAGVTVQDLVMISAGTIFTNDRYPRAFDPDGTTLKTSAPTEETLQTKVCRGVTIGAGCVIGPGVELGSYCMLGMGSVVTRSVAPHRLVYGNPSRIQGYVCICGAALSRSRSKDDDSSGSRRRNQIKPADRFFCQECHRQYFRSGKKQITIIS